MLYVTLTFLARSFYFIKSWAPCLSWENMNLIWGTTQTIFLASSGSPIFLDAVQGSYWNFFQGNFKMLFVTLLFKSWRCTFWLCKLFCLWNVDTWYIKLITQGTFSLIFVFENLKIHLYTSLDIENSANSIPNFFQIIVAY